MNIKNLSDFQKEILKSMYWAYKMDIGFLAEKSNITVDELKEFFKNNTDFTIKTCIFY